MILCYITDRLGFPGGEAQQSLAVLRTIDAAARAGVDYIQLREKDLVPRHLEKLAREVQNAIRHHSGTTRLLINGRADIALAIAADGVHLPSGEVAPSEVRALWMRQSTRPPIISVAAHSSADVRYAEAHGADFAVLAPVFEKAGAMKNRIGLAGLRAACLDPAVPDNSEAAPSPGRFPVLALGGVTLTNASECILAAAAASPAFGYFRRENVADLIKRLREIGSETPSSS